MENDRWGGEKGRNRTEGGRERTNGGEESEWRDGRIEGTDLRLQS